MRAVAQFGPTLARRAHRSGRSAHPRGRRTRWLRRRSPRPGPGPATSGTRQQPPQHRGHHGGRSRHRRRLGPDPRPRPPPRVTRHAGHSARSGTSRGELTCTASCGLTTRRARTGATLQPSALRSPGSAGPIGNGAAGHRDVPSMFRPRRPGVEGVPHPHLPAGAHGDTRRPTALHRSVRKIERQVRQSPLVVNKVVPCTASTSFRSVSVNPTSASTLREAVFQSQTVAHRRSYPDDRAHSTTANEASVAYP